MSGTPAEIEPLWAAARRAHPRISLPPDVLARFAASRPMPKTAERAADLYLVCGCVVGDPAAVRRFEALYRPAVQRAVQRIAGQAADDVSQAVLTRLLVGGPGRAPALERYAGLGHLGAWVRVVASRDALKALRGGGREVPVDAARLDRVGTPEGDLEMDFMKTVYRAAFAEAFQAALDALAPRDRLLLRYSVLDGLSVDRIGAAYGVHRATAARWVAHARQRLVAGTRARLIRAEGLTDSEFDSVTRLIRSQLDLSIRRRLAAGPE